jgi:hypothetical protein
MCINSARFSPHCGRSNAQDRLDRFPCPAELGDNLLVGKSSQVRVRPGVDADLMASYVFVDEGGGVLDDARANYEECRGDALLTKVVQQVA